MRIYEYHELSKGWTLNNSTQSRLAYLLWFLALSVIAGGRWITQIWLGPIPIADLVFQLLIIIYLLKMLLQPNRDTPLPTRSFLLHFICSVTLVWSLFRILVSIQSHEYSIESVFRDSMFFIALSSIPVCKAILHNFGSSGSSSKIVVRNLTLASCIALLTGIVSKLFTNSEGWNLSLPFVSLQSNIFSVRSDQLICAAGLLLINLFAKIAEARYKAFFISLLLIIITLTLLLFSSRAVLLASGLILAIGLSLILKLQQAQMRNWPIVLLFISPVFLIPLQQLPGVNRLLAGFGLVTAQVQNEAINIGAMSTQNARQEAWRLIADYWKQNSFWFGFKPGEHVVQISGALRYLSGEIEVRWPHNVFLSIMVRNGLIIGLLFSVLLLYILFSGLKNISRPTSDVLDFQLFAYLIGSLAVSSVGVVLESPFGYIPFTIISGMVLARGEMHETYRKDLG